MPARRLAAQPQGADTVSSHTTRTRSALGGRSSVLDGARPSEPQNRPNILRWVAQVRHVACPGLRPDQGLRHGGGDETDNQGKEGGTLPPHGQQNWWGKSVEAAELKVQCLRIADFVQPCRRVEHKSVPCFLRKLRPRARSERNRFDELSGAAHPGHQPPAAKQQRTSAPGPLPARLLRRALRSAIQTAVARERSHYETDRAVRPQDAGRWRRRTNCRRCVPGSVRVRPGVPPDRQHPRQRSLGLQGARFGCGRVDRR